MLTSGNLITTLTSQGSISFQQSGTIAWLHFLVFLLILGLVILRFCKSLGLMVMYYGAADRVMGLARAKLDDLWAAMEASD